MKEYLEHLSKLHPSLSLLTNSSLGLLPLLSPPQSRFPNLFSLLSEEIVLSYSYSPWDLRGESETLIHGLNHYFNSVIFNIFHLMAQIH